MTSLNLLDLFLYIFDYRLRAHRLVLGSASAFLKNVFRDIPQSLPEATILVPGVKRNVCQALVK